MYKQCKTAPSRQRQHHIAQSLMTLMKKKTYSQIPISAICRDSGISRNVFYRYFDSKEDVLLYLIDCLWLEFDQFSTNYRVPLENETYVRWKLEVFFSYWYMQKDTLRILINNNLTNMLFERLLCQTTDRLTGITVLPTDSEQTSMPLYLTFSIYGMGALLLRWHNQNYSPAPPKMADESLYLFTEPLFRPSL